MRRHRADQGKWRAITARRGPCADGPRYQDGSRRSLERCTGRLHVRRAKNGSPSVHPMQGDEIRALRRKDVRGRPLFALPGRTYDAQSLQCAIRSDRGSGQDAIPDTSAHAAAWLRLRTRALQAWLGHKNIQHTVRYTELAPDRFKDFWR